MRTSSNATSPGSATPSTVTRCVPTADRTGSLTSSSVPSGERERRRGDLRRRPAVARPDRADHAAVRLRRRRRKNRFAASAKVSSPASICRFTAASSAVASPGLEDVGDGERGVVEAAAVRFEVVPQRSRGDEPAGLYLPRQRQGGLGRARRRRSRPAPPCGGLSPRPRRSASSSAAVCESRAASSGVARRSARNRRIRPGRSAPRPWRPTFRPVVAPARRGASSSRCDPPAGDRFAGGFGQDLARRSVGEPAAKPAAASGGEQGGPRDRREGSGANMTAVPGGERNERSRRVRLLRPPEGVFLDAQRQPGLGGLVERTGVRRSDSRRSGARPGTRSAHQALKRSISSSRVNLATSERQRHRAEGFIARAKGDAVPAAAVLPRTERVFAAAAPSRSTTGSSSNASASAAA